MPVTVTKTTSPWCVVGNARVVLVGSFNGGASPVVDDLKSGITVAQDSTGAYTVTLPGRGNVSFASLHFMAEDATSNFVTVTSKSAANRTVSVLCEDDAGTATDPDFVHFMIVLKESSY